MYINKVSKKNGHILQKNRIRIMIIYYVTTYTDLKTFNLLVALYLFQRLMVSYCVYLLFC